MKTLWRILAVAYDVVITFRRQWMWIAQSFVFLLGFVFMFYAWGGGVALKHLIVAYLVTGFWGIGLNVAAQFIGYDKFSGNFERVVCSPLTPLEYILGYVLGSMIFAAAQIPALVALGLLLKLPITGLLLALLLSIIGTFLGLSVSLSILLRIENPMNVSAITNPLYALTTAIPPVYYPPTLIPEQLRPIALIAPTSALVDLGRALCGLQNFYPLWASAASITAWSIAVVLLSTSKMKWGEL